MASVVLLRGVNVGGHRTFRPASLAKELSHLDAVSIGAAGTFVIRRRVSHAQLRAEFARRLSFEAEIIICRGHDISTLMSREVCSARAVGPDTVHFVSVLARAPRAAPPVPFDLPATGTWLVRVLARDNRFVVGLYRRQMKAIGCLGTLDRVFHTRATTRSWSTFAAISRLLEIRRRGAPVTPPVSEGPDGRG